MFVSIKSEPHENGSSDSIDLSSVRNNTEMGDALEAMKTELQRAKSAGVIAPDIEANVRLLLTQAAREVRMPVPSKPTLIDHLEDARACLEHAGMMTDLKHDLDRAVEVVRTRL